MESNKRKDFTPKKNERTSLYSSQKRTRVQNQEEVNTSDENYEDDVIFMKEVIPPLSEFNLAQVKAEGEPDTTEAGKETTPRRRLYQEDRETAANTGKITDKGNRTTPPDEIVFVKEIPDPSTSDFPHSKIKLEEAEDENAVSNENEENEIGTENNSSNPDILISDGEEDADNEEFEENILEKLEYYKGNKNFPIYSKNKLLNISDIFKICLQRNVPPEQMVKKRPVRVTNAATFVLNQKEISLQHPFDLEADDVAGSYLKKEQTRYYEVTDDDNGVAISSTVHVLKDADGKVIKGTINERVGTKRSMKWVKRNADLNCVYAVIR